MKVAVMMGIILIALGTWALAYQRISYTREKKVIDIGPIQATSTTRKTIPLPPIVGGVALVSGVALVIVGSKRQ